MPRLKMLLELVREYGLRWLFNRGLYNVKLKMMVSVPPTERLFEKEEKYPSRLDLFQIDINYLRSFLRESLSEEDKARIISIADKACDGLITGFSSIDLFYGKDIDWQLNPLTGKRCDEKTKWYKIPDFDEERGDIKVIWEASRFSHFITFARAFLLTDNRKYYTAYSAQLKDWLERNPYSYGANFKCGQECSLRMVNALLAYTIFREAGIVRDSDSGNVKELIDRCFHKVLSNFFYAYKCIKNNHTISELMGMIVGAWCCKNQKQLGKAYKLLDQVIDEQFTNDGGYKQFSFNYQRLVLQDLELVMSISGRTGIELNNHSKEKIRKSAWLMFQCQDQSGDMPNYGSNDGALVFPVTGCGYRDFCPVINTTYALVTGRQLYRNGKHQEELIWFSGGKTLSEYEIGEEKRKSSQFPDAGLFTFRRNSFWAMIVANDYHSRPSHMDQLHFDLWYSGKNIFCDAGTYSYASNEGKKYVRNESHNTAVVEGKTQMNTMGPFMLYDWTKREQWYCDDNSFSSSMVSANGYKHTRKVNYTDDSFEITDEVDNDYQVLFHTLCDVTVNDNMAVLSIRGIPVCIIQSEGQIGLKKAKHSLYYLKDELTDCISISGNKNKTIRTTIKGVYGND